MQIQSGIRLGRIMIDKLGIDPNSRIAVELDMPTGLTIWDLDAGAKYTIRSTANGTSAEREDFEVPAWMKEIFTMPDDRLKKQWDDTWEEGWTEKRETIFTELVRRGVNMLPA
jgi:hypothetical protein